MNTPNNKRRKESQKRIENIFINLLQTKDIKDITVSEICKLAKINRSTFYANYIDIYDLAEKLTEQLYTEFINVYKDEQDKRKHSYNFLKLYTHIKDNQLFYKTYFKLDIDKSKPMSDAISDAEMIRFFGSSKNKHYHIIFFKAGLNAVIKEWLANGCQESPEEIDQIIKNEYNKKIEIE